MSIISRLLYKYREDSEKHIEAFTNNVLYAAVPSLFNDPFEFAPILNKAKFIRMFNEYYLRKENRIYAKIPNGDKVFNKLAEHTYNIISKKYKLLCFSETYNDEMMWGYYSNSRKGFVLGYEYEKIKKISSENEAESRKDFIALQKIDNDEISSHVSKLLDEIDFDYAFAKVNYSRTRHDCTELFFNLFTSGIKKHAKINKLQKSEKNVAMLNSSYSDYISNVIEKFGKEYMEKIIFNKKDIWKHEMEYRVLFSNKKHRESESIKIEMKPSVIIIGDRMENGVMMKIFEYALKETVSVEKMEIDKLNQTMTFKKITTKKMQDFIKANT